MKLVMLLFKTGVKDVNESFGKIFADLMITLMRVGVVLYLYAFLFESKGGEILGKNFQVIAWSMFLYFLFMYINPRYISADIQKDIQTGKIEILLSKPVSYIFYKLGEYLGLRFTTFIISSIFGIAMMAFIIGVPAHFYNLFFSLTFMLTFLCCFVLSYELYVILGFLSFWMQDTNPVRWIVDKFVMILGGAYFPVAFFPEILKNLSLYTPLGASQFLTYTAYANWSSIFLKMFLIQMFWIILLGIILYLIQKNAFQKLSINGG